MNIDRESECCTLIVVLRHVVNTKYRLFKMGIMVGRTSCGGEDTNQVQLTTTVTIAPTRTGIITIALLSIRIANYGHGYEHSSQYAKSNGHLMKIDKDDHGTTLQAAR